MPLPCFVCGCDLKPVLNEHQPLGAVTFRGTGEYGSTHDECGELELNVCDGCLSGRADRVVLVQRTVRTEESREPWDPSLSG
jgi:hypothetical protein